MAAIVSASPSKLQSLEAAIASLQDQLRHLADISAIRGLLDRYTSLHDQAFTSLTARNAWENLFASDCAVTYAFGSYNGRAGLGEWAWSPVVSGYPQCHLQSSNFDIQIENGGEIAKVRSNCITHWLIKREVLSEHFDAGGVYQWILKRRGEDNWEIWKLHLDVAWTSGEDLTGVSGPDK